MPWCLRCDKVQSSYPDTIGDTDTVPTTSKRYNRYGEYIGYEEGESVRTTIHTFPRCQICNRLFECPDATSKEEYFYAKKAHIIRGLQGKISLQPKGGGWGCIIAVAFFVGIVVLILIVAWTGKDWLAMLLGSAAGIGAGFFAWWVESPGKEQAKREAEKQALRSKLETLQTMQFSETSYQRLKD